MELQYQETDTIENGHGLGIFLKLSGSYCTACVAGQGLCRHQGEQLGYQYHHWTKEHLGVRIDATQQFDSAMLFVV